MLPLRANACPVARRHVASAPPLAAAAWCARATDALCASAAQSTQ